MTADFSLHFFVASFEASASNNGKRWRLGHWLLPPCRVHIVLHFFQVGKSGDLDFLEDFVEQFADGAVGFGRHGDEAVVGLEACVEVGSFGVHCVARQVHFISYDHYGRLKLNVHFVEWLSFTDVIEDLKKRTDAFTYFTFLFLCVNQKWH